MLLAAADLSDQGSRQQHWGSQSPFPPRAPPSHLTPAASEQREPVGTGWLQRKRKKTSNSWMLPAPPLLRGSDTETRMQLCKSKICSSLTQMLNIPQITSTLWRKGQYFKNSPQEMIDRSCPHSCYCHLPAQGNSLCRQGLPLLVFEQKGKKARKQGCWPGCLRVCSTPLLPEKRWKR